MALLLLAISSLSAWRSGSVAKAKGAALQVWIVDAASGHLTPARVEVLDAAGTSYVAEDALLVGPGYSDRQNPWKGSVDEALALLSKSVENPYTRTIQFYSTGNSRLELPP